MPTPKVLTNFFTKFSVCGVIVVSATAVWEKMEKKKKQSECSGTVETTPRKNIYANYSCSSTRIPSTYTSFANIQAASSDV